MTRPPPPLHRPRALDLLALVVVVASLSVLGGCKTIPEGRSAVNEVQVRGAHRLDDDDIKDRIATTETTRFLMLFRGIIFEYSLFDRFVLQRDLARVEAFYRSKGYYDAHARAGRIHQLDDRHVRVEIVVEEGVPVVVKSVRVGGLEGLSPKLVAIAREAGSYGLPVERPFAEESFKTTEGNVRRALTDHGYAYAKVKSDATVDLVAHKVDVVMTVTPGPKCTFGDVHLEGLGSLPEKVIRRTLDIKQGDEYSQRLLDDAQQALLDLGVFASVEVLPELAATPPEEASAVPLRVKVEPARLHTLRLGGGIEFDALKTDIHGLIGWESHNFFGGLRSFSVQLRPGVVLYPLRVNNIVAPTKFLFEERLRVELKQPGFPEARTNLFVRPELNVYPVLLDPNPPPNERVIGYGEVRNALGLERSIWKFYGSIAHDLQIAYPFGYVGPKDPTLSLVVISYPELYTTFDFRDDKVHPRKGIFIGNTFQVAGYIFGGDASDFKVQPEVRGYVPVSRKLVAASRFSIGLLEPKNYGAVVMNGPEGAQPATAASTKDFQLTYFRGFFSGGPNTNRGYPIRGIGPHDIVPFLTPDVQQALINAECNLPSGQLNEICKTPTGGFTLWEASLELRYEIAGPLSVATFCDASDVSPQANDFRFSHLHLSCGGGARYDTPAGPIRLDVGWRLPGLQVLGGLTPDERPPDTLFGIPIAVHIGIGEAY